MHEDGNRPEGGSGFEHHENERAEEHHGEGPHGKDGNNKHPDYNRHYWGGWDDYYGPYGDGFGGEFVVGTVVGLLPETAEPVVVSGQSYYEDDGVYYQPCYQGADMSYCVVDPPNGGN